MRGNRNIYTTIGTILVIGLVVVDRFILGDDVRIPLFITIPVIIISVVIVGIGVFINLKQNNTRNKDE